MNDDTRLARWLADEMDDRELLELRNSPEYATLIKIKENFNRLERPQFDSKRILKDIITQEKHSKTVVPLYKNPWFQMAAMVIILLAVAFFLSISRFSTSDDKLLAFTLPDNSKVILNENSQARFNKWNWENNREVSLNGEAYFEVEKGQKFVVKTTVGTVTVVGTRFNVSVRDNHFDVECFEGKVLVKKDAQEVLLTPNESIAFDKDSKSEVIRTKSHEPAWINPELQFSQAALTTVVDTLKKHYDISIKLQSDSPQLFTGSLPANDLNTALNMLCTTFHLKSETAGNNITLVPVHAAP